MGNNNYYSSGQGLSNLGNCRFPSIEKIMEGTMKLDGSVILSDFIDTWLEIFKKNSVKSATYDRLIVSKKASEKYKIMRKNIERITFFDLQEYINELARSGYGLSTVKKQFRIVSAPLKQAAALKIISADPSVGISFPKEDNVKKKTKEIAAYDKREQALIWNEIATDPDDTGYLMIALLIETGMRIGEALALKWDDVDFARGAVNVHATIVFLCRPKDSFYQDSPKSSASRRIIPLTDRAMDVMRRLLKKKQSDWVFEDADGNRYSYNSVRWKTQRMCKRCGLKFLGDHVFRHTFATNCYYKGIDIKILSKLLGHASVQITYDTYISLFGNGFEDMKKAL